MQQSRLLFVVQDKTPLFEYKATYLFCKTFLNAEALAQAYKKLKTITTTLLSLHQPKK